MQDENTKLNERKENSPEVDVFIDITNEVCPMTFVKTKLAIERLQPGQLLEVRLRGEEPLRNVPRSVREHGHEVISLSAERTDPAAPHRLVIRKN